MSRAAYKAEVIVATGPRTIGTPNKRTMGRSLRLLDKIPRTTDQHRAYLCARVRKEEDYSNQADQHFVDDQAKALEFYTKTLEFVKETDINGG